MEQFEIGKITKPQGLRGEFRVKPNNNALKYFSNLKNVFIGTNSYNVTKVVNRGGFYILKVNGIDEINEIEKFRNFGVEILVEETEIVSEDFIGYQVINNEIVIGKVIDHNNYGASDVLSLDSGNMIALIENDGIQIDNEQKTITISNDLIKEVMV